MLALSRKVVDALIQLETRQDAHPLLLRARALSEPLRLPGLATLPWNATWPAWAWILGSVEADIPLREDQNHDHGNAESLRHTIATAEEPTTAGHAAVAIGERVSRAVEARIRTTELRACLGSLDASAFPPLFVDPTRWMQLFSVLAALAPDDLEEGIQWLSGYTQAPQPPRRLALEILRQWPRPTP